VPERPNLPGTREPTNWSLALPVPVDDLPTHQQATAVAAALAETRGGTG
jgi:4-alpha-glucanotransferase